jgi:hypothetical protein
MYAITEFHIVSLFSFRALHANAFAAQTLPCPTPAGIKLALLAKLIERDGIRLAQEHLTWLAPLQVLWRPPDAIAISTATVRVYKSDSPDKPLIGTAGMREYAHAEDVFALAIGLASDDHRDDLSFALSQLRALGNAESLVQPLAPPAWHDTPPAEYVDLTADTVEEVDGGQAVVLDDLGASPSWERLNVYRAHDRTLIPQIGSDRVRRIVILPLDVVRWAEHGYALATSAWRAHR